MSDKEKISSLHDDVEFPFEDRHNPEYEVTDEGMVRGDKKEGKTVIERIRQFGISDEEIRMLGVEHLQDISEEQYGELMRNAIEGQYDTLFASIFTHWEDMPDANDQMSFVKKVSRMYKDWGLHVVGRGADVSPETSNLVISLEGADVIRNLKDVDELFDHDVRLVTLQYNDENALASERGLTLLGVQSVKKMFDLGMSVDLSHVHPKVRENVLDIAQDTQKGHLVSYTHGATIDDIRHDSVFSSLGDTRGVSQHDLKRIMQMGGIVGLGVTRPFFQSIEHLAERIDRSLQLEHGAKSLALGTDFGGVPDALTFGIRSVEDVAKLGDTLSGRFHVPDATIKDVVRNNAHEWAKGLGK